MISPIRSAALPAALGFFLIGLAPNAARATWTPAGPWYGQVNVLASSADATYAGTETGVFRTENQGATWEPKSAGLPLARVTALLVSPVDAELVLAGTDGAGVHRSTDAGESWHPATGAPGAIADFTVTDTGVFYAATDGGLLRSTNGGDTWTPAGFDGLDVHAIACQRLSGFLFAVLGAGDMRRSIDDGESWHSAATGLGGTNLYALAAHPDSAAILYTGGLGFGSDGDLYKTTNSGANWQKITSPAFPPFLIVNDLAFDAAGGAIVYVAAYGDGVLRTTNGGASWEHASVGLDDPETLALSASPATPGAVLAGVQRRGVFSTVDGGTSWNEAGTGISGMQTLAIETDHAGDRIWTGNRTGIVFSADGGVTWIFSDFEGDIGAQANAIARDPQVPGRLWAGTSNAFFKGDVLRSTNGGLNWTIAYSPSGGPVLDVVVDPETPQFIHGAFSRDVIPGGVARSTNGGLTWGEVSLGDVAVQCLAHDPGDHVRLLAGTDLGLRESLDHGVSFHGIAPELAGVSIRDVIFSGLVPDVVFVATEIGPYRSTDGGATFIPANGGMGPIEVRELALRDGGTGSRILLAATGAGCYRSTDEGTSWTLSNDGLLVTDAQALRYLPGGRILLGTEGGGVWVQPEVPTGIGDEPPVAPPARFALARARPNPIVGPEGTRFQLSLGTGARVEVTMYDAAGRVQRRLAVSQLPAGRHAIQWDGRDDAGRPVASGVYFVRADFGGQAPAVAERVAVIR